jgi:hypothetical protein
MIAIAVGVAPVVNSCARVIGIVALRDDFLGEAADRLDAE